MIRRIALSLVALLIAGCGSFPRMLVPKTTSQPQPEDLGSGVLRITLRSGFLVTGATELKARVEQDALTYCAARTGALAVIDSTAHDAEPPAYPFATVVFRCVSP